MKHLLSSTAYLVVNKQLARQVGLKAVVLLADLISKENYFIENGTIKDGWFDGKVTKWYYNGQVKSEKLYANEKCISGDCD